MGNSRASVPIRRLLGAMTLGRWKIKRRELKCWIRSYQPLAYLFGIYYMKGAIEALANIYYAITLFPNLYELLYCANKFQLLGVKSRTKKK